MAGIAQTCLSDGHGFIAAEYIWLGGKDTCRDIRSKTRLLPAANFEKLTDAAIYEQQEKPELIPTLAATFPAWSFDGSSTGQALCCKGEGENTEIYIVAKRVWLHPFPLTHTIGGTKRSIRTFLVLCECFLPALPLVATPCNTRTLANTLFQKDLPQKPWFAMEQEYVLWNATKDRPYGWPDDKKAFPEPQGPYYCANGTDAWGREFAEEHLAACTLAGIRMSGINAEVMAAQWEYQVGPCIGIDAGDSCIAARWVLCRLAANKGVDINFHAKPVEGDWNGSGMHVNFSTEEMRTGGAGKGLEAIKKSVARHGPKHMGDIILYGDDNASRMTGLHETSTLSDFSSGVGQRNVSIRIPVQTADNGFGYYEDRRPSSSADPYLVTGAMFASALAMDCSVFDAIRAEKRKLFKL